MRVVQVTRFGGPEVLVVGEAPDPAAGPGQVVVDVAVADVLFVETQIRRRWGGSTSRLSRRTSPATGWPDR